jgi:hypothetical protein
MKVETDKVIAIAASNVHMLEPPSQLENHQAWGLGLFM